jgi:hypothetical protein
VTTGEWEWRLGRPSKGVAASFASLRTYQSVLSGQRIDDGELVKSVLIGRQNETSRLRKRPRVLGVLLLYQRVE